MRKISTYIAAAALSVVCGIAAYNASAQVNVYDELKSVREKSGKYEGMLARTVEDKTIKTYSEGGSKDAKEDQSSSQKKKTPTETKK